MDKEIGQWLAIAGVIGVIVYALYQKESTLASFATGALAGYLKQSSEKGVKNEKADNPAS